MSAAAQRASATRRAFAPFGAGNRRCVATGQVEMMWLPRFAAAPIARASANPGYRLQVRVRPLPAPRGLSVQFDGLRAPVPWVSPASQSHPGLRSKRWKTRAAGSARRRTELLRSVLNRECQVCVFPAAAEVSGRATIRMPSTSSSRAACWCCAATTAAQRHISRRWAGRRLRRARAAPKTPADGDEIQGWPRGAAGRAQV